MQGLSERSEPLSASDRKLTPAEKAKQAKADAQFAKERAAKYPGICGALATQLDCMRTYDPCTCSGGRCRYHGY